MTMLFKAIDRWNAIPIKISRAFLIKLEQIILKFVWKHRLSQIANHSQERRTELEDSHSLISDYNINTKLYSQDSVVLTLKKKYRSMVQDRKPRDKHMHIWSPNL